MKGILLALTLIFCLPCFSNSIGTVSENKGNACTIERNKKQMPGQKGSGIESLDTYSTGACSSQITFKDDTVVKVTENSRLLIDDFVFDPKQSDAGKLAMKVGMGTVRYASGQIAKTNPQQVAIKTPTASIAVRGTDFTMTVDETGESLIVLVPSCKDEKDVKQYELQENTCRVGTIEVETLVGKVLLDQAFHATYVSSNSSAPTPPTIINTLESRINNNLIIVRPPEVQRVSKAIKNKKDEQKEEEEEQFRRIDKQIKKDEEELAKLLANLRNRSLNFCNSQKYICVNWERDAPEIQNRGKGTAFRILENEHIAEVKTEGYSSNTFITIVQNENPATYLMGDGSPGGNIVTIRQNFGVNRNK